MKKGQAAMEFLMTYGWAILVVLVAIGALTYFGVLSPDKFLPEKCVLSMNSGLFCKGFQFADDRIELLIENGKDYSVILKDSFIGNCTQEGFIVLPAKEQGIVRFKCDSLSDGEKFAEDITLKSGLYLVEDEFTKQIDGSLVGKVPE
jgi:hypothetical protein